MVENFHGDIMVNKQGNPRKISVSLYLAALLISAIIFAAGILVGKAIEQDNLNLISQNVDSVNLKASSLELLYLIEETPEFCPVYKDELYNLDTRTEELGYKLSYLEDSKGVSDPELKKRYFLLEAEAFLFSQKVKEKCGANYTNILYFYSNSNCTDCKQQGYELVKLKQKLGERVRLYSFDGDLGSSIVDALKSKYNVEKYPSLVIMNKTLAGLRKMEEVERMLK